jgi:galactosamine-6-phosphate isomerase
MSRQAAQLIIAELKRRPRLLLCASAGGTPRGMYAQLAAHYARRPAVFSKIRVLQIDEWAGLPQSSPATCESDLRTHLLEPLRISSARYAGFCSDAADPQRECDHVAHWLSAHGPIDVCILGLGINGHVAMNEPVPALIPHSHVVRLAGSSRKHALLKDLKNKPRFGMTLGLGEIMRSRKILLLVSGEAKRDALGRLTQPRVSSRFPASMLWLHPGATVLCDRAAAGHAL